MLNVGRRFWVAGCVALAAGVASAADHVERPARTAAAHAIHDERPRQVIDGVLSWPHATGDWWGARSAMEQAGVTFVASWTADYSVNFRGGVNTEGATFRHLFDAGFVFETEPLLDLAGGTFFIDFQTQNGDDGSEDVGDFQAYSNIDEANFTALYELWYEQWLGDVVRIKVGKVDANGEFAYVDHGAEFINSSPGYSPTILGLPTYPDPATSVNVFAYPVDWLYAGVGLYDGAAQEGFKTGRRGPSTFLGDPSDLFVIGELGFTWEMGKNLAGRLGLGGWGHTGRFEKFAGGEQRGTQGFYLVLDQQLWKEDPSAEDDDQGLGMFVQYGWADPEVSEAEHHLGAGAAWTGWMPQRDADVTGLMASTVWFTDEAAAGFTEDYELAVELFHRVQLTPWFSVKPDVQYIVNPGGDASFKDAVVGTMRVEVVF